MVGLYTVKLSLNNKSAACLPSNISASKPLPEPSTSFNLSNTLAGIKFNVYVKSVVPSITLLVVTTSPLYAKFLPVANLVVVAELPLVFKAPNVNGVPSFLRYVIQIHFDNNPSIHTTSIISPIAVTIFAFVGSNNVVALCVIVHTPVKIIVRLTPV